MAISFKESICSEKSLPHTHHLFLDPKTFKIEVSFMAPDFKFFFFPLNHAYLWKSHACCSLVYAQLKFCLLKQNILSFCRSFAELRTGGKLFLEGRFYFIVFHFSLTTHRIFKVSRSRLLGFLYPNVKTVAHAQ